jgi:hypothetical protein
VIDVLRIGLEISLINLASKELTHIARDFLGLDSQMAKTIKSMTAFKWAAVGLGSVAVGGAMAAGLYDLAKAGGELERKLALVKTQYTDMTDAQMANLRVFSEKQSIKAPGGVTPAQMAETVGENFTIFKNFDESKAMAPFAAQLKAAIAGNLGMSFEEADKAYKQLAKSAELHGDFLDKATGKFSVIQGMAALEDKFKMLESSKGMASAGDILNVEKQASNVLFNMNYKQADRFVAGLAQQFGGYRLGTSVQAFGRELYGGKMSATNADELISLGIMKSGSYTKRKGGGIDLKSGAFVHQDLLDSGDVGGFLDFMKTQFHTGFLKNHREGESEAVYDNEKLGRAIGTDTARRLLFETFMQNAAVKKEGQGVDMALPINAALKNLYDHDLEFNLRSFEGAWEGFKQSLGGTATSITISVLHGLTDSLKFLTTEIAEHPNVASAMMIFAAGLSALLIVGGGIAVIGGAIGVIAGAFGGLAAVALAPLAIGIIGVGAAFAGVYEIVKHWPEVKAASLNFMKGADDFQASMIRASRSGVSALNHWQDEFFGWSKAMAAKLPAVWTTLKGALTDFFDKFTGFFSHIGNWLSNHMPHLGFGNSSIHQESFKYDPANNSNLMHQTSLYVDGKLLTKVVTDHMGRQINRDNSGQSGFNTRSGYTTGGSIAL